MEFLHTPTEENRFARRRATNILLSNVGELVAEMADIVADLHTSGQGPALLAARVTEEPGGPEEGEEQFFGEEGGVEPGLRAAPPPVMDPIEELRTKADQLRGAVRRYRDLSKTVLD
jgi:hypothetical protein